MYVNRFKDMSEKNLFMCYEDWLKWNSKGSLGCPENCLLNEIKEEYLNYFHSNATFSIMQDLLSEMSSRYYSECKGVILI